MKPAVWLMDPINMRLSILPIMNESGVTARATNCTVTEILDDGVAFINEQGEKVISADLVV